MRDDVKLQPADPHSKKRVCPTLNKNRISTFMHFKIKNNKVYVSVDLSRNKMAFSNEIL